MIYKPTIRLFNKRSIFVVLFIISFAVSPTFASDEEARNWILIGTIFLAPIIIIKIGKFRTINQWIIFFLFSISLFPMLNHPENVRWSTIIFTSMFCVSFVAYKMMITKNMLSIEGYLKLLRILILAYFITLIIQQLCVLLGLPILNVSNYDPNEPWKLNTLTSEPSHSARILALLMFSYISVKEIVFDRRYNIKIDVRNDFLIWIAFLWTMITMGSTTAFLFLGVILFKFVRIKNLISILALGIILFMAVHLLEIKSFERNFEIFEATLSLNEDEIFQADRSGAYRIIPIIILFKQLTFSSLDGWFGHGVDYVANFLNNRIQGRPDGWTGGGLLQVWMDYGFIAFFMFILFSLKEVFFRDRTTLILWFLLVFINGLNSQILWLSIMLMSTNQYFYTTRKNTLRNL